VATLFLGEYQHSIDAKGRLILPAKIREGLGEKFIATRGFDNCLSVYPMDEWAIWESKLKQLPIGNPKARLVVRNILSGAAELEADKQGRVLIPQNLRDHAQLDKDVVVIGVSNRVEIWSKAVWDNYSEQMRPGLEQLSDDLADLGI